MGDLMTDREEQSDFFAAAVAIILAKPEQNARAI
jgi:hypothetical protein